MILLAPYSAQLPSGNRNPKNYPFWPEIVERLRDKFHLVQVGTTGENPIVEDCRFDLSVAELRVLLRECVTFISCDSFIQHLGWDEGKRGIVLWSVSDPEIYGHKENVNLLKSRECLAENQFLWWDSVNFDESKFVGPDVVLGAFENLISELELFRG